MKKILIILIFIVISISIYGISYISRGDIKIDKNDIADDIVNADGKIIINGEVYGTIYAVNSHTYINPNAAINGDIVLIGGTLDLNPYAYIGSQLIIIGTEVNVIGVADGLSFIKANYNCSYSEKAKPGEIDFMRKYLIFQRPIPRLNTESISFNPDFIIKRGFKLSLIGFPSKWEIKGLIEETFNNLKMTKSFVFKNTDYSIEINIFHLEDAEAGEKLWEKIKETDEDKVNYSCHVSIGDGAHWYFRYKNSLVLLWYKREWFFSFIISFINDEHSEIDWKEIEELRNNILQDFIKIIRK